MNPRSTFSFSPQMFFSVLALLYVIFIVLSSTIIYFVTLHINTNEVKNVLDRMKEDIRYTNNTWDMSYLNADPQLPSTHSHYIIGTDGYVIERWRPINGFLNTSDMNYLLRFMDPQTVTAPTREKWRMLSYPIRDNGSVIGVLTVAGHIQDDHDAAVMDQKLLKEKDFIINRIKVVNGSIDISRFDIRHTQYDISNKIVDKYNTVILKTNNSNSIDRTPNFIDRSYIAQELQKKYPYIIRDGSTLDPFLIMNVPVLNENNVPVGIIVVGKSLTDLQNLLLIYAAIEAILLILLAPIVWFLYKRITKKPSIHTISFDPQRCHINVNNEKIEIPEDTNQCHLCELIFTDPRKHWSVEEIAHHFDYQEGNHWRKVYDAMLQVNKRVEPYLYDKLIVVHDKQFFLNPHLLPLVQ